MMGRVAWGIAAALLLHAAASPRAAFSEKSWEIDRTVSDGASAYPGAGSALLSGRHGEALLDFGPVGWAKPPRVSPERAIEVARRFAGLRGARAASRTVALATPDGMAREAAAHRSRTHLSRDGAEAFHGLLGYAVDLVDPSTVTAVRVYVDGLGAPLGQVSLVREGPANVFERSPSHGSTLPVLLEGREAGDLLDGPGFVVRGCGPSSAPSCDITSFAAPAEDGGWLYEPAPSDPFDPFTEVNTFWHLHAARVFLASVGLDDYPQDVLAVVNFTYDFSGDGDLEPYLNAVYVPGLFPDADGLVFGHAGSCSVANDADVVRHELTHAATVHLADLHPAIDEHGFNHMPAAVGEAVADYYPAVMAGDPIVGAHFGALLGLGDGGVRRLDEPLSCPADMVGLEHDDSRILSSALWRARQVVGEDLDEVVAMALNAMPMQPTLAAAAEAVATAAGVHLGHPESREVEAILEEAGLLDCSRFIEARHGFEHVASLPVTNQMGNLSPGPFQYVLRVPPDTARVTVRLEPAIAGADGRGMLHARVGGPVAFRTLHQGDRVRFDILEDVSDREEVTLMEDWWSGVEEPVIYFSPSNASGGSWRYRLRVTLEERTDEEQGTGLPPVVSPGEDEEDEPVDVTLETEPDRLTESCARLASAGLALVLLGLVVVGLGRRGLSSARRSVAGSS